MPNKSLATKKVVMEYLLSGTIISSSCNSVIDVKSYHSGRQRVCLSQDRRSLVVIYLSGWFKQAVQNASSS